MPASKKFRRARLVVIVLAVVLVAAIGGGAYYAVSTVRESFPQTEGTQTLPGLDSPVQVRRDSSGIPQIYASTSEDLFRAQGYVQAQDRFYEMDTRRHITSGRLSEMFGEGQVETDAFLRTMGWHRVAQKEWDEVLSPSTKKYLRAYTRGVNDYLAKHSGSKLSAEYAILGVVSGDYKPAKWTPIDSVAWIKAMAWDLRSNMEDEITRALLPERLTEQQIDELYPEYPYKRNKPIVQRGGVGPDGAFSADAGASAGGGTPGLDGVQGAASARKALTDVQEKLDNMPQLLGASKRSIGSNSWVVSGDHTTTGKPLLANDPHLGPALPSTWYQIGLHCNSVSSACPFDVSGFSFAGLPGVVIGHNAKISWGFTNLAPDVTDLYLEKVVSKDKVLYNGEEVPFANVRKETIKVSGGRDRTITVRETRNGPLISDRSDEAADVGRTAAAPDSAPDRRGGYGVALKWTALDPGKSMDAVFELNRAQDFKEFRKAASHFEVPSQNLIYADTEGNIGYQAPGAVPIRQRGDGTRPAPGWDPDYQWKKGRVPFKSLPWEENPPSGYIVTANQAVIGKDYKYELTKDWNYGNRSNRITGMIESKLRGGGLVSPSDMSSMQTDGLNPTAKVLTPYLLKANIKDGYVRQAQDLLKDWDFQQDRESAAAAYYNAVWRNLLKLTFGNKLPASVRPKGQCLWVAPANDSGPVDDISGKERRVRECGEREASSAEPDGGDRWGEVLRKILPDADNAWWETPLRIEGREVGAAKGRDALIAEAMKDARYELTAKLGKDVGSWSWGRLHKLTMENQTLGKSGNGLVEWLLNRGPYQMGGGEDTVNATGWNAAAGYQVDLVPSMRMVVDLNDLDKSKWINMTGASGHVYHPNYTDQAAKWQRGELLPWRFSKGRVEDATEDTLALTPKN